MIFVNFFLRTLLSKGAQKKKVDKNNIINILGSIFE